LRLYLDASVIVALLTDDALRPRADSLLRTGLHELVVSDFAGAEFVSAIAGLVRMKLATPRQARAAFVTFDEWVARVAERTETTSADVRLADAYLRRLEHNLRTPDALHIALAQRASAAIATFDAGMAAAARALGADVAINPA